MTALRVEATGEATHEPCTHCGEVTTTVWGHVYDADTPRAVYFARWTAAHAEHGAHFLLSIGRLGEGTVSQERRFVGLECCVSNVVPGFMVVDAEELPWSDEVLGLRLSRDAVMSQPLRDETFRIVDAIVEHDPRVRQFLET